MVQHYSIPGPDDDVLTAEAVAKYIHVSVSHLERMVREGHFPHPINTGERTKKIWPGVQVACWMQIHQLMYPDPPSSSSEQEEDTK